MSCVVHKPFQLHFRVVLVLIQKSSRYLSLVIYHHKLRIGLDFFTGYSNSFISRLQCSLYEMVVRRTVLVVEDRRDLKIKQVINAQ